MPEVPLLTELGRLLELLLPEGVIAGSNGLVGR